MLEGEHFPVLTGLIIVWQDNIVLCYLVAAQQLPTLYILAEKFRNSFQSYVIMYDHSNCVAS